MKLWRKAIATLTCTLCLGSISFPQPGIAGKPTVKTSLKRYAVYPYLDQKVLCEPYQVAKDDWLYKIFRQKGEISEKDFPLFLSIFKSINPEISNIDAINPGQKILIPLKKISQEDFDETVPGIVDVPVIEFSTLQKKITPHYKRHRVKPGDTVSELIDPFFLNKDGTLTQQGINLFSLANPMVAHVGLIREGTILNLPIPKAPAPPLKSEPISPATFTGLEQYSRILQGELMKSGKYYFPSQVGLSDQILDLAYTPLIKLQNGSRMIMVPGKDNYQEVATTIRAFWPDVTLVDFKTALETVETNGFVSAFPGDKKPFNSHEFPQGHRLTVKKILEHAGYDYTPDAIIPLEMGSLELELNVGKISRPEKADLYVEFGDIYGFALDRIKKQGHGLISLFSNETTREIAIKLFTGLGIPLVENPAFISNRTYRTITIPGIYTSCPSGEILLADGDLDLETEEFLHQNKISLLHIAPVSQITGPDTQ